ncbi:hypothetical protein BH23BAC3_BH23BAC3_04400 [soil metagenome]
MRYYAGVPLLTKEKYAIGALCVLDYKAGTLSKKQIRQLKIIAKQVMTHLELHKQNRELKSLNDYKVRLMKMLSHDMRSPLSGIIGVSGMLKEMHISDDEEHIKLLDIIEQSSSQLNQMIDEVMSYTIIESDGFKLESRETDLKQLISNISRLYQPAAKFKNINLEFLTENFKKPVFIDGEKFEQIVGNLLSNAIKYTMTGGYVNVFLYSILSLKNDHLELIVEDNGLGMSDDQISDALNGKKMKASKNGTSGGKSSGIGLTIVKHFVNLFSVEIGIKSRPGLGSRFTVKIPL